MELEHIAFSAREAVEYALSMMRERAAHHGLTLSLDIDAAVDVVVADELRFKQVVLNLLSNAVKFTPDGGQVVVAARVRADELAITVTDTGVGVAAAERERIFEAVEQGPRSSAPATDGTGLGLTLCRRIVGLMGGRMWLESEVGVGSTFGFTVPLGTGRVPDRTPSTPGQPSHLPTVLVIEDDRQSVDLLTAYLESAGFAVTSAHDGPSGLDAIRLEQPRAVVLDIRLPRMDGWDVLTALKADAETAAVPVVVVSMLDERVKGLSLGAAAYLVKPVSRDALLSALATVGVLPGGPAPSTGAER